MTDTAVRMTPQQHANLAAALAHNAARVHGMLIRATVEQGGVAPHTHEALLREMHAVAALAQVHATLAAAGAETVVQPTEEARA